MNENVELKSEMNRGKMEKFFEVKIKRKCEFGFSADKKQNKKEL